MPSERLSPDQSLIKTSSTTSSMHGTLRGLLDEEGPPQEELIRWETDELKYKTYSKYDLVFNRM